MLGCIKTGRVPLLRARGCACCACPPSCVQHAQPRERRPCPHPSLTLSLSLSLTLSHTLTLSHSLTHSLTLSLTHSLTLTLALAHSLTLSLSHSLILSLSHPLTLSFSHSLFPSSTWETSRQARQTGPLQSWLKTICSQIWESGYIATCKREFKLPWREAGPPKIKWIPTTRLSLSYALTLSLAHSLLLTLSHTHSLTRSLSHSLILSLFFSLTLSFSFPAAPRRQVARRAKLVRCSASCTTGKGSDPRVQGSGFRVQG